MDRRPWLFGSVVTLALFAWLAATRARPPVHPDTARDLLQAVACSNGALELCQRGPHTSFAGHQGALWPRFLLLGHELRIPLTAMQLAVFAFIAIGAGMTGAATRRLFDDKLASLTASLAFIGLSLWATEYPLYWNPSLLPLPSAIFAWALLEHSRSGRSTTALIASFGLALSVDLHIVCLVFIPLLLVAVTASAKRPVFALALTFACFCLTVGIVSPVAWTMNLTAFEYAYGPALVMLIPISCVAIGLALRNRWLAFPVNRRSFFLVLVMVGWLAVPAMTGRWEGRYAAPSVPALSIALGWAQLRFRKRTRWALVGAAACWLAVLTSSFGATRHHTGSLSLLDIARLVPAIEKEGFGGDMAFFRVEGLAMDELSSLVALSRPAAPRSETLLIVEIERAKLPSPLPEEWTLVELDDARVAILRRNAHPFLRREDVRICYASRAPGSVGECMSSHAQRDGATLAYPPFPEFAYNYGPDKFASFGDFRAELSIAIDTQGPGASHLIELFDTDEDWQIGAVEGVSFEGELPGRRVVVHASSGEGRLILVRDFQAGSLPSSWPPILIETLLDETKLQRLYEQSAESFLHRPR